MSIYCIVFLKLVENRRFQPTSRVFVAPLGLTASEFLRNIWRQKTRVYGLSYRDSDPTFNRLI